MKKFEKPVISIQEFGTEDIIRSSGPCFEIFACLDCYCTSVTCDHGYSCDAQKCPTLSDYL